MKSNSENLPTLPETAELKSTKPGLESVLRELRNQRVMAINESDSYSEKLIEDPGFDRCFNKFDRCFNKFDRCFNKFDRS